MFRLSSLGENKLFYCKQRIASGRSFQISALCNDCFLIGLSKQNLNDDILLIKNDKKVLRVEDI
jgi:hypothetical protein